MHHSIDGLKSKRQGREMIHRGNIMMGEYNIQYIAAEGVTTEQIGKSSQIKALLERGGGENLIDILLFLYFLFRQRARVCQTKPLTTAGKYLFPVSLKTKLTCVCQRLPAAH